MNKRRLDEIDIVEFPPAKRRTLVRTSDNWESDDWEPDRNFNDADLDFPLSPIEPIPLEYGVEDENEDEEGLLEDLEDLNDAYRILGDGDGNEDVNEDVDEDEDEYEGEVSPPLFTYEGKGFLWSPSQGYTPPFEDSIPDEVYKQVQDEARARHDEYLRQNPRKKYLFDSSGSP